MADLRRTAAIVGIHEHVTRYAPIKVSCRFRERVSSKPWRTQDWGKTT